MRAGIFLAYWPWSTRSEQVEPAVLADELGPDSHLAARTERVALGSGLVQIPARAPTAAAMAAASLDVLSGGRFRLGFGVDTLVGLPCGADRAHVARTLAEAMR